MEFLPNLNLSLFKNEAKKSSAPPSPRGGDTTPRKHRKKPSIGTIFGVN